MNGRGVRARNLTESCRQWAKNCIQEGKGVVLYPHLSRELDSALAAEHVPESIARLTRRAGPMHIRHPARN